jgi:hypothetical protein
MISCINPFLGLFTEIGGYCRKLADNIFFDTYNKKTKISGLLLAKAIISHFGDRRVTLMGHSMGTELILCCLKNLH